MENQPLSIDALKDRITNRMGGKQNLDERLQKGQESQDFFPDTNLNGENNDNYPEPLQPAGNSSDSAAD